MRKYTTAQICKNGHIITGNIEQESEKLEKFCKECGAETISTCPSCGHPIRGDIEYVVQTFTGMPATYQNTLLSTPSYCINCGSPYPWTAQFLNSAEKIIDMLDDLSPEQKKQLKETFPDLLVETPNSKYSALIASKLIHKVTSIGKDILISMLKENVPTELFKLMQLGN